jgi:hypothetical protein
LCDKVRSYSCWVVLPVGIAILLGACSSDVTAPQSIVSITSSQDTMTIGALRFTGMIAIIDTTIQMSVTVKNDSTAPVSYDAGCTDHVGFALYQNVARSGTPALDLQPNLPVCLVIVVGSLAPGDSTTFTGTSLLSQVRQVASGMYYVAVPISNFNNRPANTPITVNAGMMLISGS